MALIPNRISNQQLELRRWSLDELDSLLGAIEVSFNELHTWMIWARTMPTRDQMHELVLEDLRRFDNDERWQFFIFEFATGELVGSAGLHRRGEPDELEIGYWVRSDRTGRGYATQAAGLLTAAAFDASADIVRVKISMDASNLASAAVPLKLGFIRQGEHERDSVTPGHNGRGAMWTMERRDWTLVDRI
ncbi:MAG: GNAT family protein [Acidimicrobiales bacterium]